MVEIGKGPKGKTIRERSVFVYLPSEETAKTWKELSDKAGCSISKFVIEHVENSLLQEQEKEGYAPRAVLLDELRRLREEIREIQKQNKMLNTVVERQDEELRYNRMKQVDIADKVFDGNRMLESRLVEEFIRRTEIRKENVLDILGVKPSDGETVKSVDRQIEILERYKLLKDMGGKWRWKSQKQD